MSANTQRLDAHIRELRERMPAINADADVNGDTVCLLTVFVSTGGALGMMYVAPETMRPSGGDDLVMMMLSAALDATMFKEPKQRIETLDDGGAS